MVSQLIDLSAQILQRPSDRPRRRRSVKHEGVLKLQENGAAGSYVLLKYAPHRLVMDNTILTCCRNISWLRRLIEDKHKDLEYCDEVNTFDTQLFLKGSEYALTGLVIGDEELFITLNNGLFFFQLKVNKILWNNNLLFKQILPTRNSLQSLFKHLLPQVLICDVYDYLGPIKFLNTHSCFKTPVRIIFASLI